MDTVLHETTSFADALRALNAASLGGQGQPMAPAMQLALEASFGSVQRWHDELAACARVLRGAPGWVLMLFQPQAGTLGLRPVAETDAAPAGVPLLALRGDQLPSGIRWDALYERYQQAVHAASEGCAATHDDTDGALLLDVRRAAIYRGSEALIPGARWRDPAQVATWSRELPAGREIVVYCIYGHEVGRSTALRLRAHGLNARYLDGGIDGWQRAGRPLSPKEDAS